MKAINTGKDFRIYSDHLKVYDSLPAAAYIIRFNKMQGFYLEEYSDITISEEKIYGIHLKKVDKVLNAFTNTKRNLGVILSGAKGIGKSLFAKLLGDKAIKHGYPLIVVDKFYPDIASFIEEIEQEVVVLFDEFDKTFGSIRTGDNEPNPQTGLLTLFDGIASGKKLYVVTCNELHNLNDYLINRPGRFHYHFRFECPEDNEIREYLKDKLNNESFAEIDKVVAFSKKVPLNYDCLRAIAFEINNGESFVDSIKDLNIINLNSLSYNLTLHFEDGTVMTDRNCKINLFDSEEQEFVWLDDSNYRNTVGVYFYSKDAKYDINKGCSVITGDKLKLKYDKDECEDIEKIKLLVPSYLIIKHSQERNIHYNIV